MNNRIDAISLCGINGNCISFKGGKEKIAKCLATDVTQGLVKKAGETVASNPLAELGVSATTIVGLALVKQNNADKHAVVNNFENESVLFSHNVTPESLEEAYRKNNGITLDQDGNISSIMGMDDSSKYDYQFEQGKLTEASYRYGIGQYHDNATMIFDRDEILTSETRHKSRPGDFRGEFVNSDYTYFRNMFGNWIENGCLDYTQTFDPAVAYNPQHTKFSKGKYRGYEYESLQEPLNNFEVKRTFRVDKEGYTIILHSSPFPWLRGYYTKKEKIYDDGRKVVRFHDGNTGVYTSGYDLDKNGNPTYLADSFGDKLSECYVDNKNVVTRNSEAGQIIESIYKEPMPDGTVKETVLKDEDGKLSIISKEDKYGNLLPCTN